MARSITTQLESGRLVEPSLSKFKNALLEHGSGVVIITIEEFKNQVSRGQKARMTYLLGLIGDHIGDDDLVDVERNVLNHLQIPGKFDDLTYEQGRIVIQRVQRFCSGEGIRYNVKPTY